MSDSVLMLGGHSVSTRSTLPRRIKFGLGATGVSLLLLVLPGQMVLPLTPLTHLMPRWTGCANFGSPALGLAFIGLAILISCALIGLGLAAIVGTALRNRFGLVGAVGINAVVISLLLATPLDLWLIQDSDALGLYIRLDTYALVPAAALVLLLSPTTFAAWWRSPRPFLVTAVATALLLLPGAAGLVSLGLQVGGVSSAQPAAGATSTSSVGC
jgi:hypothetical protein